MKKSHILFILIYSMATILKGIRRTVLSLKKLWRDKVGLLIFIHKSCAKPFKVKISPLLIILFFGGAIFLFPFSPASRSVSSGWVRLVVSSTSKGTPSKGPSKGTPSGDSQQGHHWYSLAEVLPISVMAVRVPVSLVATSTNGKNKNKGGGSSRH